jgi:hypothetical protein
MVRGNPETLASVPRSNRSRGGIVQQIEWPALPSARLAPAWKEGSYETRPDGRSPAPSPPAHSYEGSRWASHCHNARNWAWLRQLGPNRGTLTVDVSGIWSGVLEEGTDVSFALEQHGSTVKGAMEGETSGMVVAGGSTIVEPLLAMCSSLETREAMCKASYKSAETK